MVWSKITRRRRIIAVGAFLTKFLTTLGKKGTVSATSSFAKAMKGIGNIKHSLGQTKSGLEKIGGSSVISLFKAIANTINAETTHSQMKLLKEVMELFKSTAGQLIFESITRLLEIIVNHGANIINGLTWFLNWMQEQAERTWNQMGEKGWLSSQGGMIPIWTNIIGLITGIDFTPDPPDVSMPPPQEDEDNYIDPIMEQQTNPPPNISGYINPY